MSVVIQATKAGTTNRRNIATFNDNGLTMANNASTWQQMTFSVIRPSKPGWVTLQIQSFDNNGPPTGGAGLVRFDTVGVA